jgi:putative PIN family toxin of toxin-antitoxin system
LISGIFFGGWPGKILEAWREGRVVPVLSMEILDEYRRVGRFLGSSYDGWDVEPLLSLLTVYGEVVTAPALAERVSPDPDDDKFLACALASRVAVIVSGDRDLLQLAEWHRVRIVRPREFAEMYLDG